MITVEKKKKTIKITGHSDYAEIGKDIVCSAVSSIVITTVNAILSFDCEAIEYFSNTNHQDDDKDYSLITIKKDDEITVKLLDNMLDLLQKLSKQYPKDINVKES